MSWSDIFYPGNPERRERLIRKHQELLHLMKGNFRATNQLIETLNEHLHLSFSPIALDEKATVKENCEVIIGRIHEIQAEVEKIDQHLKEKLEPKLYEKLLASSLTLYAHAGVVMLGFLLFGIDMIVGAVEGSIERDKLERALEDYAKALKEFRPASEEYQDSITYVRVTIEMIE